MNAAEQLIEVYYQHVERCFTVRDVKVQAGNNRQIDLLAYDARTGTCYHIETTITHSASFAYNKSGLIALCKAKFFGFPPKSDKSNSDFMRGKNYRAAIEETYSRYGASPADVVRVMCVWALRANEAAEDWVSQLAEEHHLEPSRLRMLSLRDNVIPRLQTEIGTANYDDVVLRLISLLAEANKQRGISKR